MREQWREMRNTASACTCRDEHNEERERTEAGPVLEGSAEADASVVEHREQGRECEPDEIARVALFLASPYASWVTGQTIAVAGGQGL